MQVDKVKPDEVWCVSWRKYESFCLNCADTCSSVCVSAVPASDSSSLCFLHRCCRRAQNSCGFKTLLWHGWDLRKCCLLTLTLELTEFTSLFRSYFSTTVPVIIIGWQSKQVTIDCDNSNGSTSQSRFKVAFKEKCT